MVGSRSFTPVPTAYRPLRCPIGHPVDEPRFIPPACAGGHTSHGPRFAVDHSDGVLSNRGVLMGSVSPSIGVLPALVRFSGSSAQFYKARRPRWSGDCGSTGGQESRSGLLLVRLPSAP